MKYLVFKRFWHFLVKGMAKPRIAVLHEQRVALACLCLKDLLETDDIGLMIEYAFSEQRFYSYDNGYSRRRLIEIGIRTELGYGDNVDTVWIAQSSKALKAIFAGTQWADTWQLHMLNLGSPGRAYLVDGGTIMSLGWEIPKNLVDHLL